MFAQFAGADPRGGREFLKRGQQGLDGGGLRRIGNGPGPAARNVLVRSARISSAPAGTTWTLVTAAGRKPGRMLCGRNRRRPQVAV